MLLKFPPFSTVYLNSFGRFFYALVNFISIVFFSKFADKSIQIEKDHTDVSKKLEKGNDFSPWPEQALHLNEKNEEVDENFLNKILESYKKSNKELDAKNFKDSPWWKEFSTDDLYKFQNELSSMFLLNTDKVYVNF
mgnify:CR=1 FL=1